MTTMLLEDKIVKELAELDSADQQEVLTFIGYLRHRGSKARKPLKSASRKIKTAADLLASGQVGVWKDRKEIGDSVEYARTLRKQAETRSWVQDDTH